MAILLIAVFIDLVGFGLIVPILPFITQTYGGGALEGTALVSIYSLFAFLSGPVWGRLSDKIGRRRALMLTYVGAAISYLTLSFANTLLVLFLARAMSGAMAGNVGIVMAAMADLTTADNRGKAMGFIGAAFALGFAVGPGLAAGLASLTADTSILLPGLTACGLSLTALLLTAVFMPETTKHTRAERNDPKRREALSGSENAPQQNAVEPMAASTTNMLDKSTWQTFFSDSRMALLMLMFVIMAVGQSVNFSITPFWLDDVHGWTEREVGYLFMAAGLLIAFINIVIVGPLFKLFGEIGAMMLACILFAASSLGLWMFGDNLTFSLIALPMMMAGLTFAFPAMNSEVSKRTDASLYGAALGLSNGLSALGRVAGPLTAGFLFSPLDPSKPFLLIFMVGLVAALWCLWDKIGDRPEKLKASS